MKKALNRMVPVIAGIAWAAIVCFGLVKLYNYEIAPSTAAGKVAQEWPQRASLVRDEHRYQLLMFAHPQCPCTQASIGELELIMAKAAGKVNANVVFVQLAHFDEEWVKSNLYKRAENIPGVEVIIDPQAREAKLFGATTSGQVFLYDPQGNLVFAGGITAARGHAGDNAGRSAIEAMLNGKPTKVSRTPFFGCLLYNKHS